MMINKSQEGFEEFKTKLTSPCDFITEIDKKHIEGKINHYKEQDIKAKRALDYYITVNEIEQLLLKYNHRCVYCWDSVNKDNLTVDRINNNLGHIHKNCVIACKECNSERGSDDKECDDENCNHEECKEENKKQFVRDYNEFYEEKCLERFHKYHTPQVFIINEANKDIFYDLHNSIFGGPSIVFYRYHEAYKTFIQRVYFDDKENKYKLGAKGKMVKRIIGFDANALYLWCLSQLTPCGKQYKSIIK